MPSKSDADSLETELKRRVNLACGRKYVRESKDNKEKALDDLRLLQTFWPLASKSESQAWICAYRASVAHFAHCRTGCGECRNLRKKTLGRSLDPKTEVFEVFGGWSAVEQREFRAQVLAERNADPQNPKLESRRLLGQAPTWAGLIRKSLDDGDPLTQREALPRALRLWDGNANDKNMGAMLRAAYVHAELCDTPACPVCHDFRAAVRRGGSFEERRLGLLRALLCFGGAFAGKAERPLAERELDGFASKIEEFRNMERSSK